MDATEHALVVEIACPGLAGSRHALIVRDAAGTEIAGRVVDIAASGGWRERFELDEEPATVVLTGAACNATASVTAVRVRLTPDCGPPASFPTAGDASFGEWAPSPDVPAACRSPRCDELVPPLLKGAPLPSGAATHSLSALAACLADAAWTASVDAAAPRLDATVLAWLPVHSPARPARTAALVDRAASARDPALLATLGTVVGASASVGVPFGVGGSTWYLGPPCGCDGDGTGEGEPAEPPGGSGGAARPRGSVARVGGTVLLHGDGTMPGGTHLVRLEAPPALVICTCNGEVQWTARKGQWSK